MSRIPRRSVQKAQRPLCAPEPFVIAVGSTNPAKVKAVAAVAGRLFPQARVEPVAVSSGVSAQPLSAVETELGARTRARAALAAVPGARFGVGLEGGVEFGAGGRCDVVNCCAVVAHDDALSVAWGVRFPLPPIVGRRVRAGEELGTVMDELSGVPGSAKSLGAVGFLSNGLLTRDVMWQSAVVCAFMPWLHPDLYGFTPSD